MLEQVDSLARLVPSQSMPSREFLYYNLGRCLSEQSKISRDARMDSKRAFFLRMHLMNKESEEGDGALWDTFEHDFNQMFDSCVESRGIDHAVGLFHKFSLGSGPILSQRQYSYVLGKLPQEHL